MLQGLVLTSTNLGEHEVAEVRSLCKRCTAVCPTRSKLVMEAREAIVSSRPSTVAPASVSLGGQRILEMT